jgi:hypothetical protein
MIVPAPSLRLDSRQTGPYPHDDTVELVEVEGRAAPL